MAKIDGTSGLPYRPDVRSKSGKEKKTARTGKNAFSSVLGKLFSNAEAGTVDVEAVHQIESQEELASLIDDIQQSGEALVRFPGIDNLTKYKQNIRDFLAHVTGNAFMAEEQLSRKSLMNQKKYTIIKVVDQKLENLSRQILASQNEQLDLLASIEEIQGLIVDILHTS